MNMNSPSGGDDKVNETTLPRFNAQDRMAELAILLLRAAVEALNLQRDNHRVQCLASTLIERDALR